MLTLAIVVILAHFLGDYPLQGEFLSTWKSKSWYILFVHSFIWAALISIGYTVVVGTCPAWKFFFLLVGHFIIDAWKCRKWKSPEDIQPIFWSGCKINGIQAFTIDQTLHGWQLFVILIS